MPGQATEIYAPEFDWHLARLPDRERTRIVEAVRDLGRRLDRFPHRRLQGRPEFRLHVGDHRIIYRFDARLNLLELVTAGHRREVYR